MPFPWLGFLKGSVQLPYGAVLHGMIGLRAGTLVPSAVGVGDGGAVEEPTAGALFTSAEGANVEEVGEAPIGA